MKLKKKDRKTVLMVFRKIKTKCGDSDCENCPFNPDDGYMKLCDSPIAWNLEGIEKWLKKEEFDD